MDMGTNANQESSKTSANEGRPPIHDEKKTTHNISVTPTGWKGLRYLAKNLGCSSISELVERIGRQEIAVEPSNTDEAKKQVLVSDLVNRMEDLLQEVKKACQ